MTKLLEAKAIIELNKASKKSLTDDFIKVNASASWLKKVLAWCDEYNITLGKTRGSSFYISQDAIESIETWLQQNNQGSLAELALSQQGNRQQAAIYSSDEKIAKISPSEFMVLSACGDFTLRKASQLNYGLLELSSQINIEVDIRYINLSLFSYLVVIENLDSFNDWYQYTLPEKLDRALIVYRGNKKEHSKACQALKQLWLEEKGCTGQIFFGDFDLAGLTINITSKVAYQYILLPELSYIKTHLDPLQYNEDYACPLKSLPDTCSVKWQCLFDILLENKASLRQQKMFNTPLFLY